MAFATAYRIVRFSIEVDVKVAFEPLEKLEVILIFSLDKLINVDVLLHIVLGKRLLQHFVVLDELVVVLGSPFNLGHGNRARVDGVDDLTVNGTGSALLNLS